MIMNYSQATGLNLALYSIRSKITSRIGYHVLEKKNRILFDRTLRNLCFPRPKTLTPRMTQQTCS